MLFASARSILLVTSLVFVLLLFISSLWAAPPSGSGYALIWADEFTGNSLDLMKWDYNYLWGNTHNHSAYMDPSQVKVANSILTLQAVAQRHPNAQDFTHPQFGYQAMNYTSGAVHTANKFRVTHGYIEARMKMPNVQGSWPAFWMLRSGWPPEIDIMEFVLSANPPNNSVYRHHGYYHYTGSSGPASFGSAWNESVDLTADFHTYGIEWTSDTLTFYFDGQVKGSWTNASALSQAYDMYLILNLAIGGWAGTPAPDSAFPADFQIDWVRVWQKRPDGASTTSTWNIDGGGSWDSSGNWSGPVPRWGGQRVVFGRIGTASFAPITWTGIRTVGSIEFQGSSTGTTRYSLGASNASLILAADSSASITVAASSQADQTILCRLELWSNTTVRNDMASSALRLQGPIIGPGSLTVEGTGPVVLSGNNTYEGGTYIDVGTQGPALVQANSSSAFGTGPIQFNPGGNNTSGRLELLGEPNGLTIPNPIYLSGRNNGTVAIRNVGNTANTLAGTITLQVGGGNYIIESAAGTLILSGSATDNVAITSQASGSRTLTLQGSAHGIVSGIIQNGNATLNILKTGTGTWIFTANNTYTGTTTVQDGTLIVNGTHTSAGNYIISPGAALSGSGTIYFAPAAGLTISSGAVLYPGPDTSALTLQRSASSSPVLTFSSGAVLRVTLGPNNTASSLTITAPQNAAILFQDTILEVVDNTAGNLGGDYVILTADSPAAFAGLSIDSNGTITAGLSLSSTAASYLGPGALLKLLGNSIVLHIPPTLLGDTNHDGVVDLADYNNVVNNLGTTGSSVLGDTNRDGIVDLADYNNAVNNLGTQWPVSLLLAIPEPINLLSFIPFLLFRYIHR